MQAPLRSRPSSGSAFPSLGWGCILWESSLQSRSDGSFEVVERRILNPDAALEVLPVVPPIDGDWGEVHASAIVPSDAGIREEQLRKALQVGSGGYVAEFRARDRDGRIHWLHETVRIHDQGETIHLAGVAIDITSRKLSEEEAMHALAAARSASAAKSEFLANMSHEIRTPMNAVLGLTELLLQTRLTDDQRDLAGTAHRSGQALLGILNDILDLSKIEADRIELLEEPFDLRELCEEVVSLFAESVQDRGVEIVARFRPGIPSRWLGDPGRIRQILSNLVGNAAKFTDHGRIVLDVKEASALPDGWSRLRIAVEDSGIGIASDKVGGLFKAFAQADAATTRRYGGTGLGLAISRRLAKRMDGDISVSSRPGAGSDFQLDLSLRSLPDQPPPRPSTHRVLIVSPSQDVLDSLSDVCASLGSACWTFPDIEQARMAISADGTGDTLLVDMAQDAFERVRRELAPSAPGLRIARLAPVREASLQPGTLVKPVKRHAVARLLGIESVQSLQASETSSAPHALSSLRLLVAEDNAVNRMVIARQLQRVGIAAHIVDDGHKALQELETGTYDAAILDVQMPLMDGSEVARRWRAIETARRARRLPLVALTASILTEERERCHACGIDLFLTKPISQNHLVSMLARVVREAQTPA